MTPGSNIFSVSLTVWLTIYRALEVSRTGTLSRESSLLFERLDFVSLVTSFKSSPVL